MEEKKNNMYIYILIILPPSEVLEQAAQRGCGCPVLGGVQVWIGWGPGQPGLVLNGEVGGPVQQVDWRFMILEGPSNPGHSVIL